MEKTKLVIESNTLNYDNAFLQQLVLSNGYYTVRISCTNLKDRKEKSTLTKENISVNATPHNDLCAPVISGTGTGQLISFNKVMVSSKEDLELVKECIAAAEDTMEQIDGLIEQYFLN